MFWFWLAVRLLCLAPLAAISGGLLYTAVGAALHGIRAGDVLTFAVMFSGAASVFTLLARHTWRVWRGTADYSEFFIRHELEALGALALVGGVMLAIVWPMFADLVRKSTEGANKGRLSMLRQDIIDHQRAHDGRPPAGLDELDVSRPGRLELWGFRAGTNHKTIDSWRLATSTVSADSGEFAYFVGVSSAGTPEPRVYIDCTHTDTRGNVWTAY